MPSGLKGKEAQPWFDASFDEPMILFDDVVEILDWPQFTAVGKSPLVFQLLKGFWIGGVFIHRDHTRRGGMRRSQRFGEEAFRRLSISCGTEQKFQRGADVESTAR